MGSPSPQILHEEVKGVGDLDSSAGFGVVTLHQKSQDMTAIDSLALKAKKKKRKMMKQQQNPRLMKQKSLHSHGDIGMKTSETTNLMKKEKVEEEVSQTQTPVQIKTFSMRAEKLNTSTPIAHPLNSCGEGGSSSPMSCFSSCSSSLQANSSSISFGSFFEFRSAHNEQQ